MEETKSWSNRLHAFMNKILNRVIYIIFRKIVRYFMEGVDGVGWGKEGDERRGRRENCG